MNELCRSLSYSLRPMVRLCLLAVIVSALLLFQTATAAHAAPVAVDCTSSNRVTDIPQSECEALFALYQQTNGSAWHTSTGWFQTTTACTWYGITNCAAGHVTHIQLATNGLAGQIPPELGQLNSLIYLDLSNNQLTGPIPGALGSLAQLHVLELSANQLTGDIPSEIWQLSGLNLLFLSNNQLTGPLSSAVKNLSSLASLHLASNQLTGTIPSELGQLHELVTLHLEGNHFSGEIPPALGDLSKLQQLWLDNNQLTGPIPGALGSLAQLHVLELSANELTGDIPSEIWQLSGLVTLALSNNKSLWGAIPADLGNLTHLANLRLASNKFSGLILPQIARLTNLETLDLGFNQFTGTIPREMGQLIKLRWLRLEGNAFGGSIPASFIEIGSADPVGVTLDIDYNMFDLAGSPSEVVSFIQSKSPSAGYPYQIVPPTDLQVTAGEMQAAASWTPINFNQLGGYTLSLTNSATRSSRSLQVDGILSASTTITNLCPGTLYSMNISSYSPPRVDAGQSNFLVSSSSPVVTFTTLPREPKLLSLFLLAFDSNLDVAYEPLMRAIEQATAEDPTKVALVLVDRSGDADTQIYEVRCGGRTLVTAGLPDPANPATLTSTIREYNMTAPEQLAAFLTWARITHSAPQSVVTYIGHGVPLAPAVDIAKYVANVPDSQPDPHNVFALPSGQYIHPGQTTDEHPQPTLISPHALAEALRIATGNGAKPFTVLDIVHCFGGTLEELYELSNPGGTPFAERIIGSPNYAYSGPELLRSVLLSMQEGQDAQKMAQTIVDHYHQALVAASRPDLQHPHLIAAVDPVQIITLKHQVDELAHLLAQGLENSYNDTAKTLQGAHTAAAKYNTTTCDGGETLPLKADFVLDSKDALADLADLASKVGAFSESKDIKVLAQAIVDQVDRTVVAVGRAPGVPWFGRESGKNWPFDDASSYRGIAIYADFGGYSIAADTYIGWQAHWYTSSNNSGDNPTPYAFVQTTSGETWADVLRLYWAGKPAPKTAICTTKLPTVFSFRQYLSTLAR